MTELLSTARRQLKDGVPVIIATIVSQSGSTPREVGTRMLIDEKGHATGTIGGGTLENEVMVAAMHKVWAGATEVRLIDIDLTHQEAASAGMICGGRATVLLDRVTPTPEMASLFDRLHRAAQAGKPAIWISLARRDGREMGRVEHFMASPDGEGFGGAPLPEAVRAVLRDESGSGVRVIDRPDALVIAEPIRGASMLYIFGAGHVAQPTARFASAVGFSVVVIDDRPEWASPERFPEARSVRVIPDFETAFTDLDIHPDAFIVIVTRGHLHDRTVLEAALKTDAGYIGMIGSRKKREAIYSALRDAGVGQDRLDQVHSPIGLSIGAETPEEIAVSIVAELIAERAGLRAG